MNIAVMVSGGGTNLQAIIDGIKKGKIRNTKIILVFSNNPEAYALERARAAGIETACISPKDYEDRKIFEKEMLEILKRYNPDLIVLAGFLVNIPSQTVEAFRGRIINIHPSLIPSFCGKGYYGIKVHEAAIKRGVKVSGATVHYVDEGIDSGPIILQKAVEVKAEDKPEDLQKRIMEEAERVILPEAIDMLAMSETKKTE